MVKTHLYGCQFPLGFPQLLLQRPVNLTAATATAAAHSCGFASPSRATAAARQVPGSRSRARRALPDRALHLLRRLPLLRRRPVVAAATTAAAVPTAADRRAAVGCIEPPPLVPAFAACRAQQDAALPECAARRGGLAAVPLLLRRSQPRV